jgi:hypothetical protein
VGRLAALAVPLAGLVWSSDAMAQIRWDVGVEGGAMRRGLTSRPPGQPDPGFGPMVEAQGHVALLPLLRLGAYAHLDASPIAGERARDIFAGGVDLRLVFPWPRGDWRAYARGALGEAGSREGFFTEVPLALGGAYRVVPSVWVTTELGTRLGFGFGGGDYRSSAAGGRVGYDTVAVYLTAGIMFGR